jgi:hypothetical protein
MNEPAESENPNTEYPKMNEASDSEDPSSKYPKKSVIVTVAIVIGIAFVAALSLYLHAERTRNREMAQFAAITEVLLVIATVMGFAMLVGRRNNRDAWLSRLVIVTALGMCVIVVYSVQWLGDRTIPIIGVALLSAGAAWLIAAVFGFLFGIPRRNRPSASQYRPSTSLEQVSDWLTKIIVGLGLTQLNKIPGKLDSLASYIAAGMGLCPSHKVLSLAICIYFPSCGFLFGFLWARLYMLKEFDDAESVPDLGGVTKKQESAATNSDTHDDSESEESP